MPPAPSVAMAVMKPCVWAPILSENVKVPSAFTVAAPRSVATPSTCAVISTDDTPAGPDILPVNVNAPR